MLARATTDPLAESGAGYILALATGDSRGHCAHFDTREALARGFPEFQLSRASARMCTA
jgi:hypothetical protein